MICVERRIDIGRIHGRVKLLFLRHTLGKRLKSCRSVHDPRDQTVAAGKREIKQGVDPALIELRVRVLVRPRFADDISGRISLFCRLCQPSCKLDPRFTIVRKIRGHRIQPESVHTPVKPEVDHVFQFLPHLRGSQVQIRHLRPESRLVIPLGIRQGDIALILFSGELIVPHVWAFFFYGFLSRRQRSQIPGGLLKPGVGRRSVIHREIQDHCHPSFMACCDERVHILQSPVRRIDPDKILHIIFVISVRREDRHQPKACHPQVFASGRITVINIVQPGEKPRQIADPVSVTVTERVDEDLVGRSAEAISYQCTALFLFGFCCGLLLM